MLYEKPKRPDPDAALTYRYLRDALQEAAYAFGGLEFATRQIYWTLYDYQGGGRLSGAPPMDQRVERRRDKMAMAKLVRQLKKAAEANVIDGEWRKTGYVWRLPLDNYWISSNSITSQFTTSTTPYTITGII